MCGINGIIDFSSRPIDLADIELMRDVMVHRGPDAAGAKVFKYAGFGHRRLSIIDLSDRGNQPMANEDGSIWVVSNGEIYNFHDLRKQLSEAGHVFNSQSDTEVLIHGYEQWGIEGLLRRTNGMFAFGIWDTKKNALYLARDRLGKKPLYYGCWEGRFYFSSDIKSLWLVSRKTLKVSIASIARFLFWGYIPGPDTIFEGVQQLPPGSWLLYSERGTETHRYWSISFAHKNGLSWPEALEAMDEVIKKAVECRLYSDVPVGAFLSGGVDSSLVVHYLSHSQRLKARTFSIGFDAVEHDERLYSRKVAEHCQTQHTEQVVHTDAKAVIPFLVWEFGQPFGDAAAIPTYYLAEAGRKQVTVALTGDGGDESFAGYSHHLGRFFGHLLSRYLPEGVINALVKSSLSSYEKGETDLISSLKRFLRYASPDPALSLSNVDCWGWRQLQSLWSSDRDLLSREVLLGPALENLKRFDGDHPLDKALYLDFCTLLPFCYNVKVDVTTMCHSLEARSPFLDYRVVELAAGLKADYKIHYTERKYILKHLAERYLPREVIFRAKHGFSVPTDQWMANSWACDVRDIVFSKTAKSRGLFDFGYLESCWQSHLKGQARHGTRFWLLLWLELWFQIFVDKTRTVDTPLD